MRCRRRSAGLILGLGYWCSVQDEQAQVFQVCLSVDASSRVVTPMLLPSPLPWTEPTSDSSSLICKPLWDDSLTSDFQSLEWRPFTWTSIVRRAPPGPWQARVAFPDGRTLAVSTRLASNYSIESHPTHQLLYDFALLGDGNGCQHGEDSRWRFVDHLNSLPLPYFIACEPTITWMRSEMIHCGGEER